MNALQKCLNRNPDVWTIRCFSRTLTALYFASPKPMQQKGAHNAHMQLEHTKKHISETRGIRDPAFKSKTGYTYWVCPGANGK